MEQTANLASTTVAGGGYTHGSGVLNVASTGGSFSAAPTFRVVIQDNSGVIKALLKVTAINSGTQWAVASEGLDTDALAGDNVYQVLTAGALAQIRSDANQQGTLASRPTSPLAGDRYRATDSVFGYSFDGSVWQPAFLGAACPNAPTAGTFGTAVGTAANLGSYSFAVTKGALLMKLLRLPNTGDQVAAQVQAIPGATPYALRARFVAGLIDDLFAQAGMCLYDSGTGRFITFGVAQRDHFKKLAVGYWHSLIQFGSQLAEFALTESAPFSQLKIADDGTNRTFLAAFDGQNSLQVAQTLSGDWLTPTHCGVYVVSYGLLQGLTVLDWAVLNTADVT
jgi:hypothetical protein